MVRGSATAVTGSFAFGRQARWSATRAAVGREPSSGLQAGAVAGNPVRLVLAHGLGVERVEQRARRGDVARHRHRHRHRHRVADGRADAAARLRERRVKLRDLRPRRAPWWPRAAAAGRCRRARCRWCSTHRYRRSRHPSTRGLGPRRRVVASGKFGRVLVEHQHVLRGRAPSGSGLRNGPHKMTIMDMRPSCRVDARGHRRSTAVCKKLLRRLAAGSPQTARAACSSASCRWRRAEWRRRTARHPASTTWRCGLRRTPATRRA